MHSLLLLLLLSNLLFLQRARFLQMSTDYLDRKESIVALSGSIDGAVRGSHLIFLGSQGQSALQEWLRWNVCHAQLAESILHPERLKEIGERTLSKEAIQRMWPIEVAQRGFIDFLRQQYDHTQLEAIEVIHSP